VGVVIPFRAREQPSTQPSTGERADIETLLRWSFVTSSYAETTSGWAFTDERDARLLHQFFEAFGIVERSGMRSDPFELWQALTLEFRDDVLRILGGTGRLKPYRTDTERQYLTAVARGDTHEAAKLAWTMQIGTPEWLRHDAIRRWHG